MKALRITFPSLLRSNLSSRFLSSTTQLDEASIREVEKILRYQFKNKALLDEALTHPTCAHQSPNYQRLEFVGDAVLGCAMSNYLFRSSYPELGPGKLTSLLKANVSNERLARVAVRHGFYKYLRHNAAGMDDKVNDFVLAIKGEKKTTIYGAAAVKAPKVLADVVESVAASMYVDCNYRVQHLWQVYKSLLEPIVTYEDLEKNSPNLELQEVNEEEDI